jgi:hypothetical protein
MYTPSHSLRCVFIVMAAILGLGALPLYGQQTLGSILGTVTDASGSVLSGAQVTLLNQDTNFSRTASTSSSGSYAFYNLDIGTYTVSFTAISFSESRFPNILIQADRTVTLNARLKVGGINSTVTVEAAPLLNAVDTTNGYVLDSAQIENVPLATGSFTQLAVLAPGVSAELLSGTGTQTGLGNQPIWANGQRDTSNTFLFNGVNTSNLFNGKSTSQVSSGRVVPNTGEGFGPGGSILTGTSVYDAIGQSIPTPAPEAIEEIRVNTSMYDAQQGSTSGAHIDMSTKAGTNEIHGQAYLYRATDWLNAAPFFYKNDPAIPESEKVPQLHRFTAGATFGAPIIKDKLFGFLAYNAIRVTDQSSGISNIAVTPGLGSDRSAQALVNLIETNFGQTITPAQIDPAALALFNFKLPSGAFLIPSAQNAQLVNESNVTLFGKPSFNGDQAVANLDWNATKHDIISAKYFYQHDPTTAPYTNSATDGFNQHLDSGSHVASLTNALNLTRNINWTQTFGFVREKAYSFDDQALTPSTAGINLFGSNFFPGITISNFVGTQNGLPNKSINLGNTSTFNRTGVFQNRFSPSTDIIFTLGKHTVTAGASYSYTQLDIRNRRTQSAQLNFTSLTNFLEGNVRNTSSLLLGASSRYYRANEVGSYVQDKFRATPTLSLTAGLRYDWDGPLTEKFGNLFNFDPSLYSYDAASDTITNNGFIIAGNNKLFPTAGVSNSTLKGRQWGIAPRLGAVYSPARFHDKVVIRGGVGLYYDRGELFTYLSPGAGSGISGPFGVTQEPPFVIPVAPPSGATLSNPFGTTAPTPPTGNPADFSKYLPNAAGIVNGDQTFPFGSYDINNKLPYTGNFAFDIQWQPRNNLAIDLGYVGNRGRHGVIPVPFNQPGIATASNPIHGETFSYGQQATDTNGNPLTTEPDSTFDGGNTDLRTPFLGYSINSVSYRAAGVSAYDALQLHVEQRLSHGLQVGFSYTYSHSLDEQSGLGLFYNGNNALNLRDGYASSDFDRTHITNFIYTYDFPKTAGESTLLGRFTNGWRLSGLTVLQSGQPYSVEDFSGTVGSIFYGPGNDGITNPIIPLAAGFTAKTAKTGHSGAFVDSSGNGLALNPAAFGIPLIQPGQQGVPNCGVSTAGAPVCDIFETGFTTGQRNIFRQAFQKRADISLIKNTKITERVSARYTFDVYNLTNSSSFDIPGNSIGLGLFNFQVPYDPNQSTATNLLNQYQPLSQSNNQGLGQVTNTIGGPRNIQMSLHIVY